MNKKKHSRPCESLRHHFIPFVVSRKDETGCLYMALLDTVLPESLDDLPSFEGVGTQKYSLLENRHHGGQKGIH